MGGGRQSDPGCPHQWYSLGLPFAAQPHGIYLFGSVAFAFEMNLILKMFYLLVFWGQKVSSALKPPVAVGEDVTLRDVT